MPPADVMKRTIILKAKSRPGILGYLMRRLAFLMT